MKRGQYVSVASLVLGLVAGLSLGPPPRPAPPAFHDGNWWNGESLPEAETGPAPQPEQSDALAEPCFWDHDACAEECAEEEEEECEIQPPPAFVTIEATEDNAAMLDAEALPDIPCVTVETDCELEDHVRARRPSARPPPNAPPPRPAPHRPGSRRRRCRQRRRRPQSRPSTATRACGRMSATPRADEATRARGEDARA